jgi:16S rRNA (cytosine1402-N4)-methyltransferase
VSPCPSDPPANPPSPTPAPLPPSALPPKRRPRYPGKNPRRFEHKYKELNPTHYPEATAHILASGKTPAGTHRPILVAEILEALQPKPGQFAIDCTLGYGGHAQEILARLCPGGRLAGIDADPLELPKTEARFRQAGFGPESFAAYRTNFAGLPAVLQSEGRPSADLLLADLGVSSMQLDNPARGFSLKEDGPLDMRMNPQKGISAAEWLAATPAEKLIPVLRDNADEPHAELLAERISGHFFKTTLALVRAIRHALQRFRPEDREKSVRRVFQALRIEVNGEFQVLDSLLRLLPAVLAPNGRAAFLTFHSGEDRRVKKALEAGLQSGVFLEISPEPLRAGPAERRDNPRSTSAKLRWATRTP